MHIAHTNRGWFRARSASFCHERRFKKGSMRRRCTKGCLQFRSTTTHFFKYVLYF
jgi:hypothetical protein